MLEHCAPPRGDEALAGDLLEELRAGRSPQWYWKQVLSAIALGWMRGYCTLIPGSGPGISPDVLWNIRRAEPADLSRANASAPFHDAAR